MIVPKWVREGSTQPSTDRGRAGTLRDQNEERGDIERGQMGVGELMQVDNDALFRALGLLLKKSWFPKRSFFAWAEGIMD
jgi:hypothetical protein